MSSKFVSKKWKHGGPIFVGNTHRNEIENHAFKNLALSKMLNRLVRWGQFRFVTVRETFRFTSHTTIWRGVVAISSESFRKLFGKRNVL